MGIAEALQKKAKDGGKESAAILAKYKAAKAAEKSGNDEEAASALYDFIEACKGGEE